MVNQQHLIEEPTNNMTHNNLSVHLPSSAEYFQTTKLRQNAGKARIIRRKERIF